MHQFQIHDSDDSSYCAKAPMSIGGVFYAVYRYDNVVLTGYVIVSMQSTAVHGNEYAYQIISMAIFATGYLLEGSNRLLPADTVLSSNPNDFVAGLQVKVWDDVCLALITIAIILHYTT